jgi:tRNA(adenine34) deaminase
MREALRVAEEGLARGELPIGAVVVLEDQAIAAAHTRELSLSRFLVHAELLALEAADRLQPFPGNRRDVRLFTTLEPCLMCLGAAMSSFIGEITYAVESPADGAVALVKGWVRRETDLPAYRIPEIVGGLCREEAMALFRIYAERYVSSPLAEWAATIARL